MLLKEQVDNGKAQLCQQVGFYNIFGLTEPEKAPDDKIDPEKKKETDLQAAEYCKGKPEGVQEFWVNVKIETELIGHIECQQRKKEV